MTKLKLSAIPDDRPVKLTIDLPGAVHRGLPGRLRWFDGRCTLDSCRLAATPKSAGSGQKRPSMTFSRSLANELSSVTQCIHEHAERRRRLSPARIIEVVARKHRTQSVSTRMSRRSEMCART